MSSTPEGFGKVDHDALFPEFRVEEEQAAEEAQAPEEVQERKEPLVLSVMAKLARLLAEETRLLREGDFAAFTELQHEKGLLIRQAERLEHNRAALGAVENLDTQDIKGRLDAFNETVEDNMRALGAVKDAVTHVRGQAIRKLEEEKGDGVYSRDGGKKSLHHLSLNETQVKL